MVFRHKCTNLRLFCMTVHRYIFDCYFYYMLQYITPSPISSMKPSLLVPGLFCTCVPWDDKLTSLYCWNWAEPLGYSWWSIKICAFIYALSYNNFIFPSTNSLSLKPSLSLHSLVKLTDYAFITSFCVCSLFSLTLFS